MAKCVGADGDEDEDLVCEAGRGDSDDESWSDDNEMMIGCVAAILATKAATLLVDFSVSSCSLLLRRR